MLVRFAIAVVASIAASTLAMDARAAELSITWSRLYDAFGSADDLFLDGGGSSTSAASLTSGTYSAAGTHHVIYPVTGYANFSGLAGGTVSPGHISGGVAAYAATDVSGAATYSVFRSEFLDSLTIMPSDPALIGTSGSLTGTVKVDVGPAVSALGTVGVVNEEATGRVDWILSVVGTIAANAYYTASDANGDFSYFCCNGPLGTSPAPTSVVVPVTIGFIFGDPFDFGFGLNATATATASTFGAAEASGHASLDFIHTAAWQGIDAVLESDGDPVGSWTAESGSGVDYTIPATAVPEADGLAPVGLGILGIAAARARRIRVAGTSSRRSRSTG